jgi:hypothetical protein
LRKNIDILRHIVRYCDEISEAVELFGNSFEALQTSSPYKNATAMCIFQIGELSSLSMHECESMLINIIIHYRPLFLHTNQAASFPNSLVFSSQIS